jgi:hypothetical protein
MVSECLTTNTCPQSDQKPVKTIQVQTKVMLLRCFVRDQVVPEILTHEIEAEGAMVALAFEGG